MMIQAFIDAQKASQTLDDVKARHQDLLKLESQLRELYSMSQQLMVLVAEQVKSLLIFVIDFVIRSRER